MLQSNNLALYGTDLFGDQIHPAARGKLAERFGWPPFSVLDARSGEWQERKRAWLALGIKSEVGRGENLLQFSDTVLEPDPDKRAALRAKAIIPGGGTGKNSVYLFKTEDGYEATEGASGTGTSIFDPVLCELAYAWWSFPGAQIIDPFSGGSVRGIVATMMGREYWGCDLSQAQIDANVEQAIAIEPPLIPNWVCGDSRNTLLDAPDADFVFSCPPYFDLEVYSEDPADISGMEWTAFVDAYYEIVRSACFRLRDNRFAAFVIGDVRDDDGHYRNLVAVTTDAFRTAGLKLYNECVLVTAVGSLPVRINKQFGSYRKLGKTHQNVLCFVKGDWHEAGKACNNGVPGNPPGV